MAASLEKAHAETQRLDRDLTTEKTIGRRRHAVLVSKVCWDDKVCIYECC